MEKSFIISGPGFMGQVEPDYSVGGEAPYNKQARNCCTMGHRFGELKGYVK